MHSCMGSDRVCRWSFGAAGLFALWKPHRGRWTLGQFFWSFCELAQTGDSDIFYVRQPYDDGQPKLGEDLRKKCYIYTRVSTAAQTEGYSLEAQSEREKEEDGG